MKPKSRRAVVLKSDRPYRLLVAFKGYADGLYVGNGAFGTQSSYPVGTRGKVEYQSSASYGLWFFTPNKKARV